MYTPTRVVPRNGYVPARVQPQSLGQVINPMDPVGRENLTKLATAAATGGAAAYTLMMMPGASKKNKVALGALGGGLAALALLNVVDLLT
jgi:hypothetical protein